jgi:hypothetical protein
VKGQRLLRLSHPEETRGGGAEVAKQRLQKAEVAAMAEVAKARRRAGRGRLTRGGGVVCVLVAGSRTT